MRPDIMAIGYPFTFLTTRFGNLKLPSCAKSWSKQARQVRGSKVVQEKSGDAEVLQRDSVWMARNQQTRGAHRTWETHVSRPACQMTSFLTRTPGDTALLVRPGAGRTSIGRCTALEALAESGTLNHGLASRRTAVAGNPWHARKETTGRGLLMDPPDAGTCSRGPCRLPGTPRR